MRRKRNVPDGVSVLSIRLPTELHSQLKAEAERNERTISQEARRAITLHLEADEERQAAAA